MGYGLLVIGYLLFVTPLGLLITHNISQHSSGHMGTEKPGFLQKIHRLHPVQSVKTEILHHSQLAVGAGSPTASLVVDRLNKPALPHRKSPY